MREILAGIERGHERAKLAFDIHVHRLLAAIGGIAAVLGGLHALVYRWVGENSAEVRAAACSKLDFLGVKLDSKTNARPSLDLDGSAGDELDENFLACGLDHVRSDLPHEALLLRAQGAPIYEFNLWCVHWEALEVKKVRSVKPADRRTRRRSAAQELHNRKKRLMVH
jgi:hypothetical protein